MSIPRTCSAHRARRSVNRPRPQPRSSALRYDCFGSRCTSASYLRRWYWYCGRVAAQGSLRGASAYRRSKAVAEALACCRSATSRASLRALVRKRPMSRTDLKAVCLKSKSIRQSSTSGLTCQFGSTIASGSFLPTSTHSDSSPDAVSDRMRKARRPLQLVVCYSREKAFSLPVRGGEFPAGGPLNSPRLQPLHHSISWVDWFRCALGRSESAVVVSQAKSVLSHRAL